MIKYCLQLANQRDHLLIQEYQLQKIKDKAKRFDWEKYQIAFIKHHQNGFHRSCLSLTGQFFNMLILHSTQKLLGREHDGLSVSNK